MTRRLESIATQLVVAAGCAGLTGCADTHWERSVYDGLRQGNDQAARRTGSAAVPQREPLPTYDAYESERRRLRGEPPAPAAGQP